MAGPDVRQVVKQPRRARPAPGRRRQAYRRGQARTSGRYRRSSARSHSAVNRAITLSSSGKARRAGQSILAAAMPQIADWAAIRPAARARFRHCGNRRPPVSPCAIRARIAAAAWVEICCDNHPHPGIALKPSRAAARAAAAALAIPAPRPQIRPRCAALIKIGGVADQACHAPPLVMRRASSFSGGSL